MANQVLRLTSLEYDSILKDLIDYVKNKYPDEWNDFLHSNLGMMFLEAVSAVGDNLAFYINQLANELFLPTATQRKAVVNLAKLVGYTPKRGVPATGQLRFYLDSPHDRDVVIPEGLVCEGKDVRVETTTSGVITAGSTEVLVDAIQRDVKEYRFTAEQDGVNEFFVDDEEAYEFEVVDEDGNVYTEVSFFVDSPLNPYVYRVDEVVGGYRLTVNNLTVGRGVYVKAYTTRGSKGNIAGGVIGKILGTIRDTAGNVVGVKVDNLPFSGGEDRESVDEIKKSVWVWSLTQNRLVTEEDYNEYINTIPGVYRGKVKLVQWGCAGNIVDAYICEDSNGNPASASQALKDKVQKELMRMGILNVVVNVQSVTLTQVNITADVKVLPGYATADVLSRVESNIRGLFRELDIGSTLRYSDLYRVMDETEGVDYVEISTPTGSVIPASDTELLAPGGITLNAV